MKKLRRETLPSEIKSQWIAVGDSSKFTIFEKKVGNPIIERRSFINEEARKKISELTSDRPGRTFDSYSRGHGNHHLGASRHTYEKEQDPWKHETQKFIREVGAFLDRECESHAFGRLILITNSRLMGEFREILDSNTRAKISAEHHRDYAWLSGPQLMSRLDSLLASRFA